MISYDIKLNRELHVLYFVVQLLSYGVDIQKTTKKTYCSGKNLDVKSNRVDPSLRRHLISNQKGINKEF